VLPSRFLTLKEVANALELSSSTVRRREAELGLDKARDCHCKKPLRYHRTEALEVLRSRGIEIRLSQ
jgi:hypothetical protein